MTIFDRYILKEWLKILGLLMCATTGLLLIQVMYDKSPGELIEKGAGKWDIIFYYGTILPSYLSAVLLISLLLSLLFVLSKMHRNNEITAMRCAGLNIFSTTRSLWIASLFFCGVSLYLNAYVVPTSVEVSRKLLESFDYRESVQNSAAAGTIGVETAVTFDNQRMGRLWYINSYSRITKKAYGVTVSELDRQRREKVRLLAREAHYDPAQRCWVFSEGREIRFDVESGEVMGSVAFAQKIVPDFNEDPALLLLIDRKPAVLSLFELRRIMDYFEIEANPKVRQYAVRYYNVLADALGPLIILAIAIPFALAGVRVSPTVGVSKSIGLCFTYYLLNALATSLGASGLMDPLWAAWLPNICLIGVATYFFGKMR